MKILYIDHYAGGPTYGMEYRPFYFAREWVRAGHEVTVVAASESHVRARQPTMTGTFTRERVDGVDFVWCQTTKYTGNGVGRVLNIVSFLRRLRQWRRWLPYSPDVIIASSTYPADFSASARIARRHSAKVVWEVHDLWPLSPMELGGMSKWHPFIMWMQRAENRACRRADLVISMLPKADGHLRSHGMEQSKFVYVPNGVDPDEWPEPDELGESEVPERHRAALAEAREGGNLLVAYVGAHGVANALDSMLDAARAALGMPVRWVLVGGGPERDALLRRVVAEGLTNVVMLDPVNKAAIPALLRSMDVLYLGLQREPLFRFGISPNKLMDYMMAAKPIVCAIDAGNDPVADAGCGVTIAPEDPEALVAAVSRMASLTPEQRSQLGAAGRAYVEANHTFPVLARRFLDAMAV